MGSHSVVDERIFHTCSLHALKLPQEVLVSAHDGVQRLLDGGVVRLPSRPPCVEVVVNAARKEGVMASVGRHGTSWKRKRKS